MVMIYCNLVDTGKAARVGQQIGALGHTQALERCSTP